MEDSENLKLVIQIGRAASVLVLQHPRKESWARFHQANTRLRNTNEWMTERISQELVIKYYGPVFYLSYRQPQETSGTSEPSVVNYCHGLTSSKCPQKLQIQQEATFSRIFRRECFKSLPKINAEPCGVALIVRLNACRHTPLCWSLSFISPILDIGGKFYSYIATGFLCLQRIWPRRISAAEIS